MNTSLQKKIRNATLVALWGKLLLPHWNRLCALIPSVIYGTNRILIETPETFAVSDICVLMHVLLLLVVFIFFFLCFFLDLRASHIYSVLLECLKNSLKCPAVDTLRNQSELWKLHPKSNTKTHHLQLVFITIILGKKKDLNDHWYKWYKEHQQRFRPSNDASCALFMSIKYRPILLSKKKKKSCYILAAVLRESLNRTRWSVFMIIKRSEIRATISNRHPHKYRSTSHKIFPSVMMPLGPMEN